MVWSAVAARWKFQYSPESCCVEHHDSDVLVVIVVFLRLVHELRLHLDYAVEGLVGDQRLVPDVKLQEGRRPLQTLLWC